MKKVQYYLGDPFKFHKKVVDSKHKGPQKKRVEALKINIEKSCNYSAVLTCLYSFL